MKGQRGVAGKKLTPQQMKALEQNLAKVQDSTKNPPKEKKKNIFGF